MDRNMTRLGMNPRAQGLHRLLGVFYIEEHGDLGKTEDGFHISMRSRAVSENDITLSIECHDAAGWYVAGEYRDPITVCSLFEDWRKRFRCRLVATHPDAPNRLTVARH
ncbi:hypothetical protein D3227_04735 [Mesorhizobium waimense]|uniref:Uncharacterized protein n=1 Tax=Mesorhizobium waimense TaxID=1300307 RepID=A0A3A5KYP5_9HYPH|nr:hypothetical protein [Mesorhizobium waimense]RJT41988.1 hypothetical protein D3227_04735 [Mesorhizobium waimense]